MTLACLYTSISAMHGNLAHNASHCLHSLRARRPSGIGHQHIVRESQVGGAGGLMLRCRATARDRLIMPIVFNNDVVHRAHRTPLRARDQQHIMKSSHARTAVKARHRTIEYIQSSTQSEHPPAGIATLVHQPRHYGGCESHHSRRRDTGSRIATPDSRCNCRQPRCQAA